MKFLVQKIDGEIRHDFSFTLLESVRFNNWIHHNNDIKVRFINTFDVVEPSDIYPISFKPLHKNYIPIDIYLMVQKKTLKVMVNHS